jgi:hypothetical protein
LEATVLIQKKQIEEHDKQNRRSLGLYQRAIAQSSSQFRQLAIQTGASLSRDCSPDHSPTRAEQSAFETSNMRTARNKFRRPASASAVSNLSRQFSTNALTEVQGEPSLARESSTGTLFNIDYNIS